MFGYKCNYIEDKENLELFFNKIKQNPGLCALEKEYYNNCRPFGIFKDGEVIGGFLEVGYPFTRTLSNVPVEEREQVLEAHSANYKNTVISGCIHIEKKHKNIVTALLLIWHNLNCAKYNTKKFIVAACNEPKLFPYFRSGGAIFIDERESKDRPCYPEVIMLIDGNTPFRNFVSAFLWT